MEKLKKKYILENIKITKILEEPGENLRNILKNREKFLENILET